MNITQIHVLRKIRDDMLKCAKNSDLELAHGEADDLLCTLVEHLSHSLEGDERGLVYDILAAYESFDKWYA
jgi:hypothetical protein